MSVWLTGSEEQRGESMLITCIISHFEEAERQIDSYDLMCYFH